MAKINGTIPAKLQEYMDLDNIVPRLSKEKLSKIGADVIEKAANDLKSTTEWRNTMNEALKIAKQVIENKSYPWANSANVKYPLLLSACLQFNARTNPEIVQGDKVVNVAVMTNIEDQTPATPGGKTQQELVEDRATHLSEHMSYQLLGQSDNWRQDTDKLLMVLPMLGVAYRKSYFDPIDKRPQIDLCLPNDIIIDNNVSSLERAERITHVLHLSGNDLLERMRAGLYEDYSFEELNITDEDDINQSQSSSREIIEAKPEEDYISYLYEVYEQHAFLDLDEDGYKEPYIIIVHKKSRKVLRVVARYDENSFVFNEKNGDWIKINPIRYFTDYHFIPAPDGTYLSMGYGSMLYPINETINSILNQLLDAGNLANLQAGYISDALRIPKEATRFGPGEWKQVRVPPGTTIQQHLFPLPLNPPNPALFQLLELMISSGKEIGAISDVLLGQQPPANTPATTVMAMIEQGTKVYSSMLYRLYVSFKKEFEKLYNINKKYLAESETYISAMRSGIVTLDDYQEDSYGVFPVADPTMSSDAMKLARGQALMQLAENPMLSQYEIMHRYLEVLKVPNIDALLPPQEKDPPPPSPEDMLAQAKVENIQADTKIKGMQAAEIMMKAEIEGIKLDLQEKELQAEAAAKGAQITSQKIQSVSQLATTEAQVGQTNIAIAEKQAQLMQPQIQPPVAQAPDIDTRLGAVEQAMQQVLGIGQPPQQAPQQAQGQQGGMPGMGGQPPVGTPQEAQPRTAEQMAPAQHAQEAEQAGLE
jgi:hypothetical protein